MKKIRIDNYQYRVKKGRVDILLEKSEEKDTYFIPYHYVMEDERICNRYFWWGDVEDDGDLVILNKSINDCHLNRKNKEWIPLLNIKETHFINVNQNKTIKYCLALFLEINPPVEVALIEKVKKEFDEFLSEIAKTEYIDELKRVLNGEPIIYLDATVSPPNSELLRKEIETLEHFQLCKTNRLDVSYRSMKYFNKPIDWEVFGATITPISINILPGGERMQRYID